MTKIATFLLYLCILLLLSLPKLDIGLIEIGSINVYIFEIPLILSLYIALLSFLQKKRTINEQEFFVVCLYAYTFVPLVLIGILGAIDSHSSITTIIAGTRPIVYWLSGLIVILVGHEHVKLKTLFWIVTIGLLLQFINGTIYTTFFSNDILASSGRLAGRSGFMALMVVSALLLASRNIKDLRFSMGKQEYRFLVVSVIVLLLFIIFVQNRTIWIALLLTMFYFMLKEGKAMPILKVVMIGILLLMAIGALDYFGAISGGIVNNVEKRVMQQTLSIEGVQMAMVGRSLIFEAANQDFFASPVFGHGFDHGISFVNIWMPEELIEVSGIDNSFINITHKFGLVGLLIFIVFLFKIFHSLRYRLSSMKNCDNIYLRSFCYAFPVICLISLNIDALYSYPEVIIVSIYSSTGICMSEGTK